MAAKQVPPKYPILLRPKWLNAGKGKAQTPSGQKLLPPHTTSHYSCIFTLSHFQLISRYAHTPCIISFLFHRPEPIVSERLGCTLRTSGHVHFLMLARAVQYHNITSTSSIPRNWNCTELASLKLTLTPTPAPTATFKPKPRPSHNPNHNHASNTNATSTSTTNSPHPLPHRPRNLLDHTRESAPLGPKANPSTDAANEDTAQRGPTRALVLVSGR
jgi:hypothetical protein